jgi:peptide/nickel transport system ATP-binding protein
MPEADSDPILEIRNLSKSFVMERNFWGKPTKSLSAVDGVSFSVRRGEVFGLVGESGCGKTTIGKIICGMLSADSGQVVYEGRDITRLPPRERRALCTETQFIFQDPYSSLNPRMTVRQALSEPLAINRLVPKDSIERRVDSLLDSVGLAKSHKDRHPHEFSGGQRQRIGIARALALNPKLIVCDEPVSALDVSIQAQVLNLLSDLKDNFGLTYIFIAHGLNVIKHLSDRVAVMYLGKIMEESPKEGLSNPIHPYSKALMSAVPVPDPERRRERAPLSGDAPSPINPPPGCRFASRCCEAEPACFSGDPPMRAFGEGRRAACFNA